MPSAETELGDELGEAGAVPLVVQEPGDDGVIVRRLRCARLHVTYHRAVTHDSTRQTRQQ